jgi:hypothetical protein
LIKPRETQQEVRKAWDGENLSADSESAGAGQDAETGEGASAPRTTADGNLVPRRLMTTGRPRIFPEKPKGAGNG